MTEIINREASEKTKGFRLQKLRAIELILDSAEKSDRAFVSAATEYKEDVYLKTYDENNTNEHLEENKNYDSDTSFTLNSRQILNTLVAFIDLYIRWERSNNIVFGFYSTNNIGKEKSTERTNRLGIVFPDEPILQKLSEKKIDDKIIQIIQKLLLTEYNLQYDEKGYFSVIKNFDLIDWTIFINKIDWKFEQPNEELLENIVLNKIKNSRLFNHRLLNKEKIILSQLIDLFDTKQNVLDKTERFVNTSDVKVVFLVTESKENAEFKASDPVFKMWYGLAPSDKRNIAEKINDVCSNFDKQQLANLVRKVSRFRYESDQFSSDKSFQSLKYRIFECCLDKLLFLLKNDSGSINEELIHEWITILKDEARRNINDLSKDYYYSLKSDTVIEGIILELFDHCYLTFKTNGN